MSYSRNHVEIIGHLGKDPEMRSMPSGTQVANLTVATSEKWKDKQTGQPQERTEWHRIAMFGRLAEIAGEYLSKGSFVFIEGSLRTRKWQDRDGKDRYSTEIVADQLGMLASPQGAPRRESAPAKPAEKPSQRDDDLNDDIPF